MIRAALVTLVLLAPSIAAADRTWHVAGGYVIHPGGSLSGDVVWRVSDRVSVGVHAVSILDMTRESLRTMIGPVGVLDLGSRVSISLSGGYTHALGAKWDTFGNFHRIGASFAARYGLFANGRVTVGAEANWIPETHLERLYDDVDLGGFIIGLFVGVRGG